jgi:hypothetical protein
VARLGAKMMERFLIDLPCARGKREDKVINWVLFKISLPSQLVKTPIIRSLSCKYGDNYCAYELAERKLRKIMRFFTWLTLQGKGRGVWPNRR